jgi:hypothetical protein
MKEMRIKARRLVGYFAILAVVFCALMLAPKLSRAHADGNSINVTNNTNHNITHLYTAPPTTERWSSDQLNDATLGAGQSFTLTNVSCSDNGIKVIAEDQDGCFVSAVVSCTENAAWSITNDLTPDCGN